MFEFRRITLFCLEKRLSKHKITIFFKMFGGHGPFGHPWLRLWEHHVILQINVEGWTSAKGEVLQRVSFEEKATLILVQETHQTTPDRLKLSEYTLVDYIPGKHHGIATFVSKRVMLTHVESSGDNNPTQSSVIKIQNVNVTNIYHTPPASMVPSKLPKIAGQATISSDFNCRHENWVYSSSNTNGVLTEWQKIHNLQPLHNHKQ